MQTEYKPFHAGGKWFWYRFRDKPGSFVLPFCYFIRLKAGALHTPTTGHVTREYDTEAAAVEDRAQAVAAFEAEPRLGTPINQLSGRPGERGYAEYCRIAATWGHG